MAPLQPSQRAGSLDRRPADEWVFEAPFQQDVVRVAASAVGPRLEDVDRTARTKLVVQGAVPDAALALATVDLGVIDRPVAAVALHVDRVGVMRPLLVALCGASIVWLGRLELLNTGWAGDRPGDASLQPERLSCRLSALRAEDGRSAQAGPHGTRAGLVAAASEAVPDEVEMPRPVTLALDRASTKVRRSAPAAR